MRDLQNDPKSATASSSYQEMRTDPVGYLYAEHRTQLALCNLLEELFKRPRVAEAHVWAAEISHYLARGFQLHAADEGSDLARAIRYNSIGNEEKILSRLVAMHREDLDLAARLRGELEVFASGLVATNALDFVNTAYDFVERLREHISWENRELLPLAYELPRGAFRRLGQAISDRHKRSESDLESNDQWARVPIHAKGGAA